MRRNEEQIESGEAAENRFKRMMESRKARVQESTKSEDMYEHFDYRVFVADDSNFTVDVKAMKKICREEDEEVQDEYVWVEFMNVNNAPGWLYGEADYIAFETKTGFSMVDRKKLSDYCDSVVDKNTTVSYCRNALNKVYRRKDRRDSMTLLELELIPHTKIIDREYNP